MIFYKTVSAGNDFLHVNAGLYQHILTGKTAKSELAIRLCDRQTGAGADGIVYYRISGETVDFEIYNRDGGEAELSGNGMAGASALLFYLDHFKNTVVLNTRAGTKTNKLIHVINPNKLRLQIDIGPSRFDDIKNFPFLEPGKQKYTFEGIDFYPVSVGNPHAVVILDKDIPDNQLEDIGKRLESGNIFPYRTNVEFVILTPNGIDTVDFEKGTGFRVYFYERGVGPTLASSTGSSAVYAVLYKLNMIKTNPQVLTIKREGINEGIRVSGGTGILIENTTEIVYKGEYL